METLKGKTKSGFEFEFDKENIDMELLDLLADLDDNPALVGKVLTRLLGKEQKKALYDSVRDDNGRVPIDKVTQALIDIFNSVQNGKNS